MPFDEVLVDDRLRTASPQLRVVGDADKILPVVGQWVRERPVRLNRGLDCAAVAVAAVFVFRRLENLLSAVAFKKFLGRA